jgi:Ni/Co efflux regulator RcnB
MKTRPALLLIALATLAAPLLPGQALARGDHDWDRHADRGHGDRWDRWDRHDDRDRHHRHDHDRHWQGGYHHHDAPRIVGRPVYVPAPGPWDWGREGWTVIYRDR